MKRTPLFQPFITMREFRLVKKVLRSRSLSRGPFVEEFEKEFAKFTGRRYAVAVSSGTCGLDLCLKALDITKNDEVITSAYSFVASTNCILYQGAKPVFCDVHQKNGLININQVKKNISSKTRAILPVDIFGQTCNLSELNELGLPIIVDSCESFGAPIQPGALANVYGFYPNKQITTGEGGMIVTDSKDFADKLRSLRNQGFKNTKKYLDEITLGFNFRMSDINAAIGIAQLKNASRILKKRKTAALKYSKLLNKLSGIQPIYDANNPNISVFNYPVTCKSSAVRNSIILEFQKNNIEYSLGFPPLIAFRYIRQATDMNFNDFPSCTSFANHLLCLPMFTSISKRQIKRVVKAIKKGLANATN